MNGRKTTITLLACCCTILTVAPSALADFVRVISVTKTDLDTDFLCAEGNGAFVPGPLTVCSVFAIFDDPDDRLLSTGNAELQVFDGENPDVFFQHPANSTVRSAPCADIPDFPDLICDTFCTIGYECGPSPPANDATSHDDDLDIPEFNFNGHITGGWFNAVNINGQGDAGQDPPNQNLQVLFLQSSVARGLSLSGDIDIFWLDFDIGEVVAEVDVSVECADSCGFCPTDTNADGDTGAADLAVLLGSWGPVSPDSECIDADDDGIIGASDLAILLGEWGPCCTGVGVPDEDQPDADGDTVRDDCDNCPNISNPSQNDCDEDGIGDACTIADGIEEDCNDNGLPDNCDEDCNENGIADECDVGGVTSRDCNENEIPDECEPGSDTDCNGNGIPDLCDVFDGVEPDCNENGIADSCDIAPGGVSDDCNQNGTPDECDIFVQTPGGPFYCLLDCADDCNDNGIPDVCEIDSASPAPGGPFFCETDCAPDCNDNGIPDECDVAGVVALGPTEPVNTTAYDDDGVADISPVIASDGMGTWLAAWRISWDPYFARSEDNGNTWTTPMPLGNQDGNEQLDRPASVAFGNNIWVAVWRRTPLGDFLNWQTLSSRSVDGLMWSAPAIIASYTAPGTGANSGPLFLTPVSTDGDGTWVAAWYAKDPDGGPFGTDIDIFFARSTDDGFTWSEPAALNTNATSDLYSDVSVRLDTDREGNWIAVWSGTVDLGEGDFEGAILFTRSLDNGLTWSAPQPLTNPSDQEFVSHSGPTVAMSGDTWVVVWSSTQDIDGVLDTDRDILAVRSSDGGATWSDPQALNSTATDDSFRHDGAPDVSSSGSDWVVVWESGTSFFDPVMGFDVDIFYARSSDDALSWSRVEPLGNSGIGQGNSDGNPRIASDGAGNWIAVWESDETLGNSIGHDSDILSVDFEFASGDCNHNGEVDECEIADGEVNDCTGNGVPDECEPDCNENEQADSCDILDGISLDCNTNEMPDECEPQDDCNENDVQDICDIAESTSRDCNLNGVPDECEPDCNGNEQADSCDIADGISADCNANNVPDECEPQNDCNENGVQDICDIATGTSGDCNSNGVPDECEPADDDGDGVPDDCDNCNLFNPDQTDCQSNGVGDVCDLADGTSEDCDANDVPDECEPRGDCNENGVPDLCDIGEGASEDCDENGVPDECEDIGPQITLQPVSQEVEAGELVVFLVDAQGLGLQYQWRKDGMDLEDNEHIFGSQGSLLVILEAAPADAGEYDCVITDIFGCSITSEPAILTVLPP